MTFAYRTEHKKSIDDIPNEDTENNGGIIKNKPFDEANPTTDPVPNFKAQYGYYNSKLTAEQKEELVCSICRCSFFSSDPELITLRPRKLNHSSSPRYKDFCEETLHMDCLADHIKCFGGSATVPQTRYSIFKPFKINVNDPETNVEIAKGEYFSASLASKIKDYVKMKKDSTCVTDEKTTKAIPLLCGSC